MSREIKFRYVYKCKECGKVITKDLTLEQVEGLHIGFESVGSVQCSCDSYGRNFAELVDRLQFTGLTDRNGVEIYEGDLIKFDGEVVEVKYYEKGDAQNTCPYMAFFGVDTKVFTNTGKTALTRMISNYEYLEVIGNRLESELMEGKE